MEKALGAGAVVVVPAFIAAAAAIYTAWSNSQSQRTIEEEKFQAELIKKFIEGPTNEVRINNLRFLSQVGLIPKYSEKVSAYLDQNPGRTPALSSSTQDLPRIFGADNRLTAFDLVNMNNVNEALAIVTAEAGGRGASSLSCSGVRISPARYLTASYCAASLEDGINVKTPGSSDAVKPSQILPGRGLDGLDRLVVLVTPHQADKPVLKPSSKPPNVGDQLILGYIDSAGNAQFDIDGGCRVSAVFVKYIEYKCNASGGSGGGAVVSRQSGELLAIHTILTLDARRGTRVDSSSNVLP